MTDQHEDDNTNNGGGLRKQLEEALAKVKALEADNSTLKAQARTSTISDLLKAKKYDAKVAELIPANIEATADGVQGWLDKYGDVFNVQKEEESGSTDSGTSDGGDGEVDQDEAMAYIQTMRQMGNVNGGMLPPDKAKDLLGKINDPNLKPEELMSLIHSHGGGAGSG